MRLHFILFPLLSIMILSACTRAGAPTSFSDVGGSKRSTRSEILAATDAIERERRLNLPKVAIGDTYVFDNPLTSWEVIEVSADNRVTWVSNQGARIVTSNNPLLPSYEWNSESDGSGKRLIADVEGSLFPLRKGNNSAFRSTVSIAGQRAQWNFQWRCAILGEVSVTVPAGNFDTFRIACARDTNDTITYYFSPDLGYYVRMETGGANGSVLKQRSLVSYNNLAGASLQASNNLKISDENTTTSGLQQNNSAPILPLPIDGLSPSREANDDVRDLLARRTNNNNQQERVLPVPGILEAIDPSGNLTEGSSNNPQQGAPRPLIPDPRANTQQDSSVAIRTAPPAANILAGQTVVVHLASYRNQEHAERGWGILTAQYPQELGGKQYAIRQVELGALGTFFRLFALPFDSLSQADTLCRSLKAKGFYCQVSEI